MSLPAEIQGLVKKRGTIKSKLTHFSKFIDTVQYRSANSANSLTSTEVIGLEQRVIKNEPLLDEFDHVHSQIESMADDADEQSNYEEREDFENAYYHVISIAKDLLLGYKQKSTASSAISQTSTSQALNGIKLPSIELPRYNGCYENWLEFRDTFQSLINDNESISAIQKFHYLRSSVCDSAKQVIQSLEFSASNYAVAWDVLCSRYNNKRLLVHNHVKALFDLESITKESSHQLRKLIDNLSKHLRSLELLGQPTEHWDTLIIYIVCTKLDNITVREWERCKNGNDVPTLSDLIRFLQNRADFLETIEPNSRAEKRVHKVTANVKSLASNVVNCSFCNGDHFMQNCAQFIKLDVDNRMARAKDLKVCLNCFKKGHFAWRCKTNRCARCNGRHNSLLHAEQKIPNAGQSENNSIVASCSFPNQQVLLSTAVVNVLDANSKKHTARALLDCGSQSSFITKTLCDRLKLHVESANLAVSGIAGAVSQIAEKCVVKLQAQHNAYSGEIICYVLPNIMSNVPNHELNINELNIPKNIKLADASFATPGKVDILIGADRFWNLISVGQISLGLNKPILQKTRLGWIVSGPTIVQKRQSVHCSLVKTAEIQRQLAQFWELEENWASERPFQRQNECENIFKYSTRRTNEGRFIVTIPFKEPVEILGESKERARKRFLALERKFQANVELRDSYVKFMEEYEAMGHMSLVKFENFKVPSYYMPHHGVIREASTTTKLRVVFNGSWATTSGVSINDLQMTGPVIQDDLLSIALRFRKHLFVASADIAKMYRQVLVSPDQRPLQRILWRSDPNHPLQTYELNTVTYGTTSASFLAIRCLQELSELCKDDSPKIANVIKHDFYVDDLLTGANSIEELTNICKGVKNVLKGGCFDLRKWISNTSEVLQNLGESQILAKTLEFGENDNNKTLGLTWSCQTDELNYSINIRNDKVTKRSILSVTAQIFDPLGLLSPCVIVAKIMLQNLWAERITWDESLPSDFHYKWLKFKDQLQQLNELHIPRHVLLPRCAYVELHAFSDASERAYGGCIYVKSINDCGQSDVRLLCAKSKVAPLKVISLPKLELCGAVTLARLYAKVLQSWDSKFDDVVFWTDSTIVLGWLKAPSSSLKTFVANRVSEVQDLTNIQNWRHVPTEHNPADFVSRGITPNQIINCDLWWNGPSWLRKDRSHWPRNLIDDDLNKDLPEVRIKIQSFATVENNNLNFERFSNLSRLERIIAYCLRFKINTLNRNRERQSGPITVKESRLALHVLVKISQNESFSKEIKQLSLGQNLNTKSSILSLNPFIDNDGILRVGGRLRHSPFAFEKRHQIILSSKHYLTKLIFKREHMRLMHAGNQLLLASVRDVFWPISGRNLAKRTIRDCVHCFRRNPKTSFPMMGDLPAARVTPGFPFQVVGVDYAGPLQIKDRKGRGCKILKGYICLFVCFASKAIHLELVTDLSTDAFLLCLKRFISRRGKPSQIYSDNGTNFLGAKSELEELSKFLKTNENNLKQSLASEEINWHFIPARAPHFGGLWEAGDDYLSMSTKGPDCRVMLRRCLAIIVRKEGCQGDPGDFWMYESGYLLFQGLIAANSVCWWSSALQGATRGLTYRGYVSPGALLVSSEPCSLEVLRGAWARRVLQPPAGYQIVGIEDIEECLVSSVAQTQWTPLPEAVCAVVLRLSSQGRPAGIESIREALIMAFPHVSPPSERTLYDTLAQLTTERKLYHTSKGYFIVTPERRRSRSHSRGRRRHEEGGLNKSMLMSTEEALVLVHGEMATIRDGEVTHQCIQTNLADVICGGNPSDKILYPRNNKRRSASFPAHRSPDRRGSFRLWGSSRRLRRSASTRTLAKHYTDSSSSTDYPNSSDSAQNTKKPSLLSRLFRRSKRSQCQINSFSAQFPPAEWFNSKAIHLHSVSTQTSAADKDSAISLPYYFDNSEVGSARSATLPRQHRRQLSNDSTYVTSYAESREQSPSLRHCSPLHASSTLPRNSSNLRSPFHSVRSYTSSRKTSRSSLSPKVGISNNDVQNDSPQRTISGNSPIREPPKASNEHPHIATKTSSLESLKTSHTNSSYKGKNALKMETHPHIRSEVNESTSAMNKSPLHELTAAFKNSVALDNSGPSSIESHKSSKTASSVTSGPSSLESHRTVISRPPPSGSIGATNSQNLGLELKATKRTFPKKKDVSKYKTSNKAKSNDSNPKSKISHSNSFTLQVTTNQGGTTCPNNTNNAMTTTINGGSTANTKIYVQNSPVRSVITFENGQHIDANPNVVIINGTEPVLEQNNFHSTVTNGNNEIETAEQKYPKNTNTIQTKDGNTSLNNSPVVAEHTNRIINEAMNNSRKLSLQLPSKEGLSYRNLLKNVPQCSQNQIGLNSSPESPGIQGFGGFTKNSFCSNPPSPTKSYDSIYGSSGNVFSKYMSDSKTSLDKSYCHRIDLGTNTNNLVEKNILGSEPNISYKEQDYRDKTLTRDKIRDQQFPSLSDLSFNFTSLAAQKILKGVSINSIDTLVELNTAAVEKQNNCDVVHTDFGLV